MVTRPAEGIPAAPIAAAVAVKLANEYKSRPKKIIQNKQTNKQNKQKQNKAIKRKKE